MALEYVLRIDSDFSVHQMAEIVADRIDAKIEPDQLSRPGLTIHISPETERGYAVIKQAFGFSPTVRVVFRLDKFEHTESARKQLLSATLELLRRSQGNAVLLFNNEDVVLLRTHGRLILNDESGFWTSDHLSEIDLPYRMSSIGGL